MEQKRNTHVRQSRYQAKPAPASSRKKAAAPKSARPGGNHHHQDARKHPNQAAVHHTTASRQRSCRRKRRFRLKTQVKIAGILILVFLLGLAGSRIFSSGKGSDNKKTKETMVKSAKAEEDVVEMEETKEIAFEPHCVDSTKPENLISYTNIEVDGNQLENISDYQPDGDIQFNVGEDYTDVDGIVTFRGNSFRDNPTHGYANMTNYKLNGLWSADTGSLASGDTVWTGSGWTGQPLLMKWPKEVKAHMNMTEKAKADDDLVEVIYACMDGNFYFLDLKTGKNT